MKEFRYNNATIRIKGNPDRDKVEAAAILLFKKIQTDKRKRKENQNGNNDTTGTISKE